MIAMACHCRGQLTTGRAGFRPADAVRARISAMARRHALIGTVVELAAAGLRFASRPSLNFR
jgi:hypothetical protein